MVLYVYPDRFVHPIHKALVGDPSDPVAAVLDLAPSVIRFLIHTQNGIGPDFPLRDEVLMALEK